MSPLRPGSLEKRAFAGYRKGKGSPKGGGHYTVIASEEVSWGKLEGRPMVGIRYLTGGRGNKHELHRSNGKKDRLPGKREEKNR